MCIQQNEMQQQNEPLQRITEIHFTIFGTFLACLDMDSIFVYDFHTHVGSTWIGHFSSLRMRPHYFFQFNPHHFFFVWMENSAKISIFGCVRQKKTNKNGRFLYFVCVGRWKRVSFEEQISSWNGSMFYAEFWKFYEVFEHMWLRVVKL